MKAVITNDQLDMLCGVARRTADALLYADQLGETLLVAQLDLALESANARIAEQAPGRLDLLIVPHEADPHDLG